MSTRWLGSANLITAGIFVMLCIKFSAAQFSYAAILFGLFLLCDFWRSHKGQQKFWPGGFRDIQSQLWGMAVFYLLILLPGVISHDWASMKLALSYAAYALPFFMCWFIRCKYRVDAGMQWGILLGAGVVFALGLYEWSLFPLKRIEVFFSHPNKLGTFIAVSLPVLCFGLMQVRHYFLKIIYLAVIAAGLACLCLTESRGAIVGLFGGAAIACVIGVYHRKHRITRKKLIAGLAVTLICLIAGGGLTANIISERKGLQKIGGERIMMLEASYHMWQDHKLVGVGLAHWQENYYSKAYHPSDAKEKGTEMPHNMMANFFSTTGTLGGIGYCVFLLASFVGLYKMMGSTTNIYFSISAMTVFLAFTIQSMVDQTIIYNTLARIYFALMGYFFAAYRTIDARDKENSGASDT